MSGVRIIPGETELTRIVGAYSSAAFAVSAMTAALAAEYGASPAAGRVPEIEAVETIAQVIDVIECDGIKNNIVVAGQLFAQQFVDGLMAQVVLVDD